MNSLLLMRLAHALRINHFSLAAIGQACENTPKQIIAWQII